MMQSISNWISYVKPPTITESKFTRGPGFWSDPSQEKLTGFFQKLTDVNSQRENWYQVTPYVAEFWCTVTNVGFIYAGVMTGTPELVVAGGLSILGHAVPKNWTNLADKLGVGIAAFRALREYQFILKNPKLALASLAALGITQLVDAHSARGHGDSWAHNLWHCTAAAVSGYFFYKANQSRMVAKTN